MTLAVIILAAGQGTRMKSKTQKILHEVGGKPMVQHVFEEAVSIADLPPVLVIGPGETGVRALLGDNATYAVQPEQLGTGHAARMAKPLLQGRVDQVLITYGDMPLLRASTMRRLANEQQATAAAIALLSVEGNPDSSFGRVIREKNGKVVEIVEVSEARQRPDTEAILAVNELNAGIYCFNAGWLWQHIEELPVRQARSGSEYYLTDMVELAVSQGREVVALSIDDGDECLGAGTRSELVQVEKVFRRRANQYWLDRGVTFINPETVYIDQDVIIGKDTIIWPNTYLQGQTTIGEDCILGPNTIIRQAELGDHCIVEQSQVENTTLEEGTRLPPFTWRVNPTPAGELGIRIKHNKDMDRA
jgi:bifunctional UDP-N-acetylglucosamine pyrophosphorylase/glucosamine-1-phosphate N-acetyltransferase